MLSTLGKLFQTFRKLKKKLHSIFVNLNYSLAEFDVSQGRLDAIDINNAVNFVISCMNFDGGFGCRPGSESHAG